MKVEKRLEQIVYCSLLALFASILTGLTLAVWMGVFAAVTHG